MNSKATKITRIALSVAFIAIGAGLAFPTKPPITLQTLCIFIVSVILKPSEAFLSALIYVILGAVGVPIFSNFQGGIGTILDIGGGFIISFPIITLLSSYMTKKFRCSIFTHALTFTVVTLISYVFGTVWIELMGYYKGSFKGLLTACILPFIPFDAIKIAIAVLCTTKLEKIFNNGTKQLQKKKSENTTSKNG